ncbi:MAG: AMP-binding protein [Planctomycetaceae bacterium]|nr:AMP-binding protein [Planctomycetaceae bacterium]
MKLRPRDLLQQPVTASELQQLGLTTARATDLADRVAVAMQQSTPQNCWQAISSALQPADAFAVHQWLYASVYRDGKVPGAAWIPQPDDIASAHVTRLAASLGLPDYPALYEWSIAHRAAYWQAVVSELAIRFSDQPAQNTYPADDPHAWLPSRRFNIVDSCFSAAADRPAIVCREESGHQTVTTYGELLQRVNRVAGGLREAGLVPGDRVGMMLPMTTEAVAAYLGTIKAGCVPVSIAESFAAPEIAVRLRLSEAKAIFLVDVVRRAGRQLPCYDKFLASEHRATAIVLPATSDTAELRDGDVSWSQFLSTVTDFTSVVGEATDEVNILFSSGTTGEPKAIPWSHSTPLKCAADARYHHNIGTDSVVAWPTSLGWMMGPWLIFATLLNRGTMALFDGAPNSPAFCRFVEQAGVTMLGVIPSLVRAWRTGDMLSGVNWTGIDAFSSTGECSSEEDMLYLMAQAGYRPVIEYCGGTEIGGGYITSTIVQANRPSCFSTPALGIDLVLLDQGRVARQGEVFLAGPSIGLSQRLLNADHEQIYFADTPDLPGLSRLRRHGDEMEQPAADVYRAGGRTDDSMNLGGIKVSAVELERCLNQLNGVRECAAVACATDGGPSELVICVVPEEGPVTRADISPERLQPLMQQAISSQINPLFRVRKVLLLDQLPRTASNKVMRRQLRDTVSAAHR